MGAVGGMTGLDQSLAGEFDAVGVASQGGKNGARHNCF
jgi:hypothetical protein